MVKTTDAGRRRRRRYNDPDGKGSFFTPYFGIELDLDDASNAPPPDVLFPVAFLIEMDPERTLRPHYHEASQFQVVVAGDGTIGKHPLETVSVHYADAYTPYGPIVSGPRGLGYLTLRNGYDGALHYMPESRVELAAAQRAPRAHTSERIPTSEPENVIFDAPDGLRAAFYRIAPGSALTGPDPATGAGQYWVELAADAQGAPTLDALTVTFLGPDEPPRALAAGASAREVLFLQFPR